MSHEFDSLLKEATIAYEGGRSSRFDRVERLGAGGMSVVYRALDRTLNRDVALKTLRTEIQLDPEMASRFRREAQIAASLDHPNIVKVFDAGEENERLYIVMECVEGRSLKDVLAERVYQTPQMLRLLEQAARGVAAAHGRGIVHRDIKPANILVTEGGVPKVADFGLALVANPQITRLTRAGSSIGTPAYMAPEQAEGRASELSPRTDVYGLGAILYEILTGRTPHMAETTVELLGRILQDDPVPPRKRNPNVPRDVEAICMKALEKAPARRYADAAEFADDLKNHFEGRPLRARPIGPARTAAKWISRHKGFSAVAAAALAGLSVLIGTTVAHAAAVRSLQADAAATEDPQQRAGLLEQAWKMDTEDAALRLQWEQARKRADAVRFTAEAEAAEGEFAAAAKLLKKKEKALEDAEEEGDSWAAEKPQLWALRAEVEGLRRRVAERRAAMIGGYTRAAGLDPDYSAPRTFLAKWFWDRFEEAELTKDIDTTAESLAYVRQYDDEDRTRRRLEAPGTLNLRSEPAGARATLFTFETLEDGRSVPAHPRALGTCPVHLEALTPGSYLVVLQAEGRPEARCPAWIRRGATLDLNIEIWDAERIGDGFVYIPGGELLLGEADDREFEKIEPFAIARYETTWTQYVDYLNDRYGARAAAKLAARPETALPEWKGEEGRIVLLSKGDWPALGISWHEATDYCLWRSERDPQADYRLPTAEEWEAAARGADGRRYLWGEHFDWSFANGVRSQAGPSSPVPVGSFAKDESVYGVRDMAGNAEEWCSTDFDEVLGLKHMRGGSWDDESADDFQLGEDSGDKPYLLDHDNGFRVVRVYSK